MLLCDSIFLSSAAFEYRLSIISDKIRVTNDWQKLTNIYVIFKIFMTSQHFIDDLLRSLKLYAPITNYLRGIQMEYIY